MVLENINLSEDKIGRPLFRSNDTDSDFCHQSVIYAVSSVYFNHICTLDFEIFTFKENMT
jgi:hypothetical protein